MRRHLFFFLLSIAFNNIAFGQTCDSQNFNSHSDKVACEIKQTNLKSLDVDKVFDEVMVANAKFESMPGTRPNLFTVQLATDQKAWREWIAEDCRLQGEVSMGTAASDIEQECLQDAYSQRIKVLRQIIQMLGN
jgi:uncharacterized protein YecT (DUF1311 family)